MNFIKENKLFVRQRFEAAELIGFETRNKYLIMDESQQAVAFAAEQQKGIFGWFMRQFLGHWRSFDISFFDNDRNLLLNAHHPFRFFFQRFEVRSAEGKFLGALQQRFAIFSKKFDVLDSQNNVLMEVRSPLWRIWTFPFTQRGQEVARIEKKWTGLMAEAFTDKDTFMVSFSDSAISEDIRYVILASSVFVDLQYFEKKAN